MNVRRIVPNINSADPSASRSFYEGVLGLDVAMDMGWIITFASPTNPTAQVSVVASDSRSEPHADISIEVADVDACHAAAQRQGFSMVYPLTDEPRGRATVFCQGPQWNHRQCRQSQELTPRLVDDLAASLAPQPRQ